MCQLVKTSNAALFNYQEDVSQQFLSKVLTLPKPTDQSKIPLVKCIGPFYKQTTSQVEKLSVHLYSWDWVNLNTKCMRYDIFNRHHNFNSQLTLQRYRFWVTEIYCRLCVTSSNTGIHIIYISMYLPLLHKKNCINKPVYVNFSNQNTHTMLNPLFANKT
jgi:hypothetical protein